jgi:hypothetical protein
MPLAIPSASRAICLAAATRAAMHSRHPTPAPHLSPDGQAKTLTTHVGGPQWSFRVVGGAQTQELELSPDGARVWPVSNPTRRGIMTAHLDRRPGAPRRNACDIGEHWQLGPKSPDGRFPPRLQSKGERFPIKACDRLTRLPGNDAHAIGRPTFRGRSPDGKRLVFEPARRRLNST